MPLAEAGEQLGPYEILALIGKGGMGEVYRAHDPRMGRDVAVKLSAEQFSERFSCEVHAVAALNHPNICHVYDVGPNYLVMELVEGTTLAELIKEGGPIPFEEALRIARQIADALEEAHEKGIVHRDLKPGNIKVRPDGTVKVLDFGLAKMGGTSTGKTEDSPTMTMSPTQAGMIMGTAAYMSPEQARGKPVDKRADIWAFGVVLYEMLTGKQAFTGETVTDILAAVVKTEPDWNGVPEGMRRLLRRCIEKDPNYRLRHVGDFELLLEPTPPPSQRSELPWAVAAILGLGLIASVVMWSPWRKPLISDKPLVRLNVDLGTHGPGFSLRGPDVVLSPDGSRMVYLSQNRLFMHRLDQSGNTELAGTEGASCPFFSPDGQWIGFVGDGKLKKVSVEGGTPLVLCNASFLYGASWGKDDTIIGALFNGGGLTQISSAGGTLTPLTQLDRERGERVQRWPQVLPGGRAVLFTSHTSPSGGFDSANIDVLSLPEHRRKTLVRGATYGRYLPSGHLVYVNRGTLFAVPFDLKRLQVLGTASPVLENVRYSTITGVAQIDFSGTNSGSGTLVYRSGTASDQLVTVQWLDEAGHMQPILSKPGAYTRPHVSPDGQRVAIEIAEPTFGVWVYNWSHETMTRVTFGGGNTIIPLWHPDGRHIVVGGLGGLSWTRADGAGRPQQLTQSNTVDSPWSFTSDGKLLAFIVISSTANEVWTVPVESSPTGLRAGKPEPLLQGPFDYLHPAFSPDGRWLAYASNESGAYQIYVQAFPLKGSPKVQVSGRGGAYPLWSRNGHELFFRSPENEIMVAGYTIKGDGFTAAKPTLWSEKRLADFGPTGISTYDVAPDGKRIVALMPAETEAGQAHDHVVFILNFFDELRRRVPTNR